MSTLTVNIEECNYDAKRSSTTFKPLFLSAICNDFFPEYPHIPNLLNCNIVKVNIVQNIRMVHMLYDESIRLWNNLQQNPSNGPSVDSPISHFEKEPTIAFTPSIHHLYKFKTEEMVFHMRRVLDVLVQLTYLMTNQLEFAANNTIEVDSIGYLVGKNTPKSDLDMILIGDGQSYEKDDTDFIAKINQIFNGFKHCLIHDESYMLFSTDHPAVRAYYIKKDLSKKIIYHNHNLHHLMMGFQDNIIRILKNQKKYLEGKTQ